MRRITTFLLASVFALTVRAEVATIVSQDFTGFSSVSAGSSAAQLGSTDWWRCYAQPKDFSSVTFDGSANFSLKFGRAQAAANRGRTIMSSPISGNIGAVSFRVFGANAATPVDATASVFLGTANNYKDCTGWPNVSGVLAGSVRTVTISTDCIGMWTEYKVYLNTVVPASAPQRVGIGFMDLGANTFDIYVDDIKVYEMPSSLIEKDPLTTTEGLDYAVSGIPGALNSVHPEISFTSVGTVSNIAATLYYRMTGNTDWTARPMHEDGSVWHVDANTIDVGTSSGVQLEMYVAATYDNEEGEQTCILTYTAANPLAIDILPRGIKDGHDDLVVTGAFNTAMSLATNGVWVGGYERAGGVQDTGFRFHFGEDNAIGNGDFSIPFEKPLSRGADCPAPASIDRDIVFRVDDTGVNIGSVFYADYQSFEDWENTAGTVWTIEKANPDSDSGVVVDAALAQGGSAALLLRAGDSLVLDKSSAVGTGEIGFWFRRAGTANASVSLMRHRQGQASNDSLPGTYVGIASDRYSFARIVLASNQSPMDTDKVFFKANTDVYIDGAYASDCSSVLISDVAIEPQPIQQNTPITVTATFTLRGGGKLKADSVLLKYGQGNDASCATEEGYFSTTDGGSTWVCTLTDGVPRSDADFYAYVVGVAQDYKGASIGDLQSATQCVQVIPYSDVESVAIADGVNTTEMRLASDRLWKGALPSGTPATATYWFLDSEGVTRGDADATTAPAKGDLSPNEVFALTGVSSALAFEYNEAEQTYRIQQAHYDPMRSAAAASPAWTRTSATEAQDFFGGCLKYSAGGTFISPVRPGVGQVMFWAARAGSVPVTYTVAVSKSDTDNSWENLPAANGGTGTIAGENMRFFSALVGDPEVKRVRVTFTGGVVYVQDAVVTASGSFVTMSNAQFSTDGVAYAASQVVGPTIPYGGRPYLSIDLVPENGAYNVSLSVEAIMADIVGGGVVPVEGADIVTVPMQGVEDGTNKVTYTVMMPALVAGATGYRFVATYDGEDASPSTYPKTTTNPWYSYTTDSELEVMREPDFSQVSHKNSTISAVVNGVRMNRVYGWNTPTALDTIGFTPTAMETSIQSTQPYVGIGRIYFRAFCMSKYGRHELAVQTSSDGSTWETVNNVEIAFGSGSRLEAYSQYCIEVNDYENKYLRIIRTTQGVDSTDYIYFRDLVVTPPTANVRAELPSIIHPGYPSKNDDITFALNVANIYESYPAANAKATLRWRRVFGSVNQPWQATRMVPVAGAIEDTDGQDFELTLPAMNPGKLEYYAEISFSGASYRYVYDNSLPLRFYYAGDDAYLEEDPRNGNESCTPSFLFSDVDRPAEFTHTTEQRALEAPTEYENRYLWFKVRAFESQHDHLQVVYTNALEAVETNAVPNVYTNDLQLIGDNLWLTTLSVTNDIHYFMSIEGVAPYGGAGTTEYLAESTFWGDDDQETVNPPLASVAGTDEGDLVEVDLGTTNTITVMVRFDATTGSYQIRRAAYQDFNDWGADTDYFEESLGLFDVETYEQAFDGSAQFIDTVMGVRKEMFDNDEPGEYRRGYFTSLEGWELLRGEILRERLPREKADLVGNVAARIASGGGALESGANSQGVDYVKLRGRASFGGDGNTPYCFNGFAWQDYTFTVTNLHVTSISDGNPYVQVMVGYHGPYDYLALRLTQTATIDKDLGTLPHIRQELIKVQNGVETVLQWGYIQKFNAGNKSTNLVQNENDGNNVQMELTNEKNKYWTVEMYLKEGTLKARAFIPGETLTNLCLSVGAPWTNGGVSFDTFDAVANFRTLYINEGGTGRKLIPSATDWYLGGPQLGDPSKTRWMVDRPSGSTGDDGLTHVLPALQYTIGIAKAGESATLPARTVFETGTPLGVSSLAYADAVKSVHYWGNAFVCIEPELSDADLVVDDVEIQDWRGRSLPEDYPANDRYWQAREAVVTTRNGSRMLALTTSRANPAARQMVSTPEMLDGIGTISFNYEVSGGNVTFVVEHNSVGGAYSDDAGFVVDRTVSALNGEKGEVYQPVRLTQTGKIRVRVLQDQSGPDATLYLDNFFAKGFPEDDGRSWSSYNSLIVAPTRNKLVDEKQFEEDVTTQTAFLNNSVDGDTRQNTSLHEHLPFIQSPIIDTGVGEIAFWYRAWNARDVDHPGRITFWVAEDPGAPDDMWRQVTEEDLAVPERDPGMSDREYYGSDAYISYTNQVAAFRALSNITNGDYQYFSAEICNDTNYVLRICSDTNGSQRVAIDNVIVTEPVRASIEVLAITMYPNTIPLANEDVGFEVLLGNPRMNPTDIHVYADYHVGTNVWGVANWGVRPDASIELVQDSEDPYLYRSSPGDMIPGLPVDSVVQYRIRVTYTGTFASPVTSAAFENPEWYEPVDLNVDYGDQGFSPYYWVFSCPTGCVYINEFYPSAGNAYDNREFVEIMGPSSGSIGGWYIDVVDGGTSSRLEDDVTYTCRLPMDAVLSSPEVGTNGWGFYVVGDNFTNLVDFVWENGESKNLKTPGGIRLRRSMGAYVDRVSWGVGTSVAGTEMVERGYRYGGTRGSYGDAVRASYAMIVETDRETGEQALALGLLSIPTINARNSEIAEEFWGPCPYKVSSEFVAASAEAISEYFDKHLPKDFYCLLELNSATELLTLSVDNQKLVIGDDFTAESLDDNALSITLKAASLAALDLSTNETHTITFNVDKGMDPTVELVVVDKSSESGDKSTDVSIEITGIEVVDGKVVLTVAITNNEPDKTVEGWSWGVKSAASLEALGSAEADGLEALTDDAIAAPLTKELDADADAQFYKAVLDDGE